MTARQALPPPLVEDLCLDTFDDDRDAGEVVGTRSPAGVLRDGTDRQSVIGIDGGAARIRPLPRPGWRRAVLAYGPFPPEPGLTLVAHLLNGHNSSQTFHVRQPWRAKLRRLLGDLLRRRLRFRVLRDNLAVGWFDRPVARHPRRGASFVMRSGGPTGGELRVHVGGRAYPAWEGVQNLPIYYVVALREQGATYYVSSASAPPGLGPWPKVRPLGIDPWFAPGVAYAGIHQSVLGEIGFRVDSRIYGVRVARDSAFASWCQQAHLAARGVAVPSGTALERGGRWSSTLAPPGMFAHFADPGQPSGLVHVLVDVRGGGVAGLTWRSSESGAWYVAVGRRCCTLIRRRGLEFTTVARTPRPRMRRRGQAGLQVLDDGSDFGVYLDGQLQFGRRFAVDGADGTGVGTVGDGARQLSDLEAHPLEIDLRHLLSPGQAGSAGIHGEAARGDTVVFDEQFAMARGELAFPTVPTELVWRRELGDGRIVVTAPGSARVDAEVDRPNPGRTLYTTDWLGGHLADLELTVTAPGTRRGQGHSGRGGVVFWQDPDNYLIVSTWLDDSPGHDGSSVSSFLRSRGHEVPRDAVWSNVGRAITWGVPYRLRISCDGERFSAWVDDRPVLYRALTDVYPDAPPLRITRVGIAVNWEYGNDTGSTFHRFTARTAQRLQGAHQP